MRISFPALIVQQTLCCLSMLIALGRCCALAQPPPLRALAAALLGALASAASVLTNARFARLLALAVMCAAPALAWPRLPSGVCRRVMLPHLVLSLCFSGLMRALCRFMGAGLALPLSCLVCVALPHMLRRADPGQYVRLHVSYAGRRITCTALSDSGNLLRDAVTGLPVIVLSRRLAARLTPLPAPGGSLSPGMRYLPFRTAAGAELLIALRPDRVTLTAQGQSVRVSSLIGILPHDVPGLTALVPGSLLARAQPASDHFKGGLTHEHDIQALFHRPRPSGRAGGQALHPRAVLHRRLRAAPRSAHARGGAAAPQRPAGR
ncbi:MAG: sigma-E processing peptidase SpoIIGA [bacterium]|nr:sigma-E processing peptidase SpoIIGA [bacterium]